MARQLRVEYEGVICHVTVRSNSGGDLFVDDGDREYMVYRVGESAAEHRVKILSYCLMANHFHLVAEAPVRSGARLDKRQAGGHARCDETNCRLSRRAPTPCRVVRLLARSGH
jgi:putative transposase